jgi:hypothetical protein
MKSGSTVHNEQDEFIYPSEIKINLNRSSHCSLLFLSVSSVVEGISAEVACGGVECTNLEVYALLVGAVSFIICALHLAQQSFAKEIALTFEPFVAVFLMIWWCMGAMITTFWGPFTDTKNGFFSSWISLFLSINLTYHTVTRFQDTLQRVHQHSKSAALQQRLTIIIVLSSLVVLLASSLACYTSYPCDSRLSWGIVASIVSFAVSITILFRKFSETITVKRLAIFLATWWTVTTILLTFGDAFQEVGNGYFASWIGCLSSLYLAFIELTSY